MKWYKGRVQVDWLYFDMGQEYLFAHQTKTDNLLLADRGFSNKIKRIRLATRRFYEQIHLSQPNDMFCLDVIKLRLWHQNEKLETEMGSFHERFIPKWGLRTIRIQWSLKWAVKTMGRQSCIKIAEVNRRAFWKPSQDWRRLQEKVSIMSNSSS